MTEDIIVKIKALDETGKAFDTFINKLNQAGISSKQFDKEINKLNIGVKNATQFQDKLTDQTMSYGQAVKKAKIESQRFKSEWLSIMFLGMALDRTFGGLINSQMQLWGVSNMLSAMWQVTLAPIMELLVALLFPLIELFMDMPESVQLVVGVFTLLVAIMAKIIMFVGMIKIGLVPLVGLFKGVTLAAVGGFLLIVAKVILVIAIIVAVIAVIYLIVKAIIHVWKNWDTIWENIKNILSRFGDFIYGIIDRIVNFFREGFKKIGNFIGGVIDFIKGLFWGAYEFIKSIPSRIVDSFKNLGNQIRNAITNLLPNWMIELFRRGANIAGNITGTVRGWLPSFQTGGIMPHNGLAMLHKGERIVPRREVDGEEKSIIINPTFNINASVASDYDVRKLASQLNEYWADDFRRLIKMRGV